MTHCDDDLPQWPEDARLPAEDEALYLELTRRLPRELSDATVSVLEATGTPEPLTARLRARLNRVSDLAEAELGFDAHLATIGRSATLAVYVGYLRKRSGLSALEAAKRFRVKLEWLTALERNLLRPRQIPARRLAALVRGLLGTLERTEELLGTTIQASRWIPVTGRDSLFRGGPGARGLRSSPSDPEVENPLYAEERQAAEALREALRREWGK